jgi:hypothetical protein
MPNIDDIKEEHDVDTFDQYIGAHVRVPIGEEIRSGKVSRRKREMDGNVIAENMYAQCDIEGRQYNLMDGIVDHKTDGHAVEPADMYIKHGSNKKVRGKSMVVTCVLNGKMGPQAGSACQISRKATQLKLLNMMPPRACLTLLIFVVGPTCPQEAQQNYCCCNQTLPQADSQVWN